MAALENIQRSGVVLGRGEILTSRRTVKFLGLILLATTCAELLALGLFVSEPDFADRSCVGDCAARPAVSTYPGVRNVSRLGDRPLGRDRRPR